MTEFPDIDFDDFMDETSLQDIDKIANAAYNSKEGGWCNSILYVYYADMVCPVRPAIFVEERRGGREV